MIRGAQSGQFVIPANGRVPVQGQGQFIRCFEADGIFSISVNNSPEMYFASGISFTAPDFEDYTEFALINRTGTPVTVIMAWGFGTVTDSRLTATGNLFVINAPATALKVEEQKTNNVIQAGSTSTITAGTTVAAIVGTADQTSGMVMNTGWTTIYLGVSTASATLVASGIPLEPGQVYYHEGGYQLRAAVAAGSCEYRYMRFGRA